MAGSIPPPRRGPSWDWIQGVTGRAGMCRSRRRSSKALGRSVRSSPSGPRATRSSSSTEPRGWFTGKGPSRRCRRPSSSRARIVSSSRRRRNSEDGAHRGRSEIEDGEALRNPPGPGGLPLEPGEIPRCRSRRRRLHLPGSQDLPAPLGYRPEKGRVSLSVGDRDLVVLATDRGELIAFPPSAP